MERNIKRINVMKRAHEIRKEQQLEGNYNVQMKIALKLAWAEAAKKETIKSKDTTNTQQDNTNQKEDKKDMNLCEKITFVLRNIVKDGKLKPKTMKGEQYLYYIYHENDLSINFHVYKNSPERNILVGYVNGCKWVWNIKNYMYPCINMKQDKEFKDTVLKILSQVHNEYKNSQTEKETAITNTNRKENIANRLTNATIDKLRIVYLSKFKNITLNNIQCQAYQLNSLISIVKKDDKFIVCHTYKNNTRTIVSSKEIITAVEVAQQLKYISVRCLNYDLSEALSDDIKLLKNTINKGILNAKEQGIKDASVA